MPGPQGGGHPRCHLPVVGRLGPERAMGTDNLKRVVP
jgi:hypothetical protein